MLNIFNFVKISQMCIIYCKKKNTLLYILIYLTDIIHLKLHFITCKYAESTYDLVTSGSLLKVPLSDY